MRYTVAVGLVAAVALGTGVSAQLPGDARGSGGDFTRIFEHLPPFAPPNAQVRAALIAIRAPRRG